MKRGEAKIEFYTNLEYFKKEYESGMVVSKFLYQKAVGEKNIKMTYPQFNKYFNDILKTNISKNKNIEVLNLSRNNDIKKESITAGEPIKIKISTKEKVFDALYGKEIKEDDIL